MKDAITEGFLGLLIASLLYVSTSGCLAVPVKAPRVQGPSSGTFKGKVDLAFLKEGVTTRDEVREKLEWLDTGYKSEKLFVARWLSSDWATFWGVVVRDAAGGVARRWGAHTLLIEFDEGSVVHRYAAVADRALLGEIPNWTATQPPLDFAAPVELSIGHSHAFSPTELPTRLLLAGDSLQFVEQGNAEHTFAIPLEQVRRLDYVAISREGTELSPERISFVFHFREKTPAGREFTFSVDVPTLITLARYAQETGVHLK